MRPACSDGEISPSASSPSRVHRGHGCVVFWNRALGLLKRRRAAGDRCAPGRAGRSGGAVVPPRPAAPGDAARASSSRRARAPACRRCRGRSTAATAAAPGAASSRVAVEPPAPALPDALDPPLPPVPALTDPAGPHAVARSFPPSRIRRRRYRRPGVAVPFPAAPFRPSRCCCPRSPGRWPALPLAPPVSVFPAHAASGAATGRGEAEDIPDSAGDERLLCAMAEPLSSGGRSVRSARPVRCEPQNGSHRPTAPPHIRCRAPRRCGVRRAPRIEPISRWQALRGWAGTRSPRNLTEARARPGLDCPAHAADVRWR